MFPRNLMSISRKLCCQILVIAAVFPGYHATLNQKKPLRDSPSITASTVITPQALGEFLSGDFMLLRQMENLPTPVSSWFVESGGSRYTVANPGEEFTRTDVILDSSLPKRRLILAGVAGDKCFVHSEHGGVASHANHVLFKSVCSTKADPIAQVTCFDFGKKIVRDFDELRRLITAGDGKDSRGQERRIPH
jgi:hypothetical protein